MSADLRIHIITKEFTLEHYKRFNYDTLGSKYFRPKHNVTSECYRELFKLGMETPSVGVGEVSWLKAALLDDIESFIPSPIELIVGLIDDDCPIIDDKLIEGVETAMTEANTTGYELCEGSNIIKFLKKHKGKRVFTISW